MIKSYLINFRKLYRLIAIAVAIIGILLIPLVNGLVDSKYLKLSSNRKIEFYKNLFGNFTSQLGSVVVFSTDKLLINFYT